MALSCCRRLPQLSLQFVFTNSHTTVRKFRPPTLRWKEDVRNFQPSKILLRGFRSKKPTSDLSNQVHSAESEGSFSLIKSATFVTGVCSCGFLGAMIWNYERIRKMYMKPSSEVSNQHPEKAFGIKEQLKAMWIYRECSSKLVFGIVAANIAVCALWKVPRLQARMIQYFSSSPGHPKISMVLSSFSHISILHLFVNMYVLLSFAPVVTRAYGPEQFSAFYIGAGTMSAFASIMCQRLLKRPLAISVGASGAIMGLLGVTGILYPKAQLQIAFVSEIFPHSFSAESGLKAVVLFDLLGLFMGWKVLDHAGHLGGMLFGILYAKYGSKLVWENRESVLRVWHSIRGPP